MIRLYNVLREFCYLSATTSEENEIIEPEIDEAESVENVGLTKALDTYRKIIEKKMV